MSSCSKYICSANELHVIMFGRARLLRRVADCRFLGNALFLLCFTVLAVDSADATFLGRDSCSSSGCHGGAGARQNQSIIWSRQDPHARSAATLTSARSKRIAQVAKISDPTSDRRCTACHSPWHGLSAELFPANLNIASEAVSCEACHGPASNYIRSHTRADLNRSEKGLDDLRDLSLFYNRANACVACHHVLEPALFAAGHPELIFELDGQTSAMPRHWIEKDKHYHLKGWLTGQAAALRESTAQLIQQKNAGAAFNNSFLQWDALLWILSRALPQEKIASLQTNIVADAQALTNLHRSADVLALQISVQVPTDPLAIFKNLSAASSDFKNSTSKLVSARRAERLVLALERLAHAAEVQSSVQQPLADLFTLVQSRPDFDPGKFAAALELLRKQLPSP